MTTISDDVLCDCGYKTRQRVEGRTIVCDVCGKPPSLPFCVDCKWYDQSSCVYPIDYGLNLVTGERSIKKIRDAEYFRRDGGENCGHRARYFERWDK